MKWQHVLGITLLHFPFTLLSQEIIVNQSVIQSVFVDPGYSFSGSLSPILDHRPDAELAHQYLITDYGQLGAGLKLKAGKRVDITLAGQSRSIKATDRYLISFMDPLEFEVPFDQLTGYLSVGYAFKPHWRVFAGASLLSATKPVMVWQELPLGGEFVAVPKPYKDWLLTGGLALEFERIQIRASAGEAKYQGSPAYQADLQVAGFPFTGMNTRIEGNVTWLADSLDPDGRWIAGMEIEQKLFKSLWAEVGFRYGHMQNYYERNGYSVFNLYDPARSQLRLGLIINELSKNLGLSITYEYTTRMAAWDLYDYGEFKATENMEYNYHSLTAGITWRF